MFLVAVTYYPRKGWTRAGLCYCLWHASSQLKSLGSGFGESRGTRVLREAWCLEAWNVPLQNGTEKRERRQDSRAVGNRWIIRPHRIVSHEGNSGVNQRHVNTFSAPSRGELNSNRLRTKELAERRFCLSGCQWQPVSCNDDLLDFQKGGWSSSTYHDPEFTHRRQIPRAPALMVIL